MGASVTPEPMPQSGAERTRLYRERLAANGAAQTRPCLACGRLIQLLKQVDRGSPELNLLCNPCWRKSPAGKAVQAERKRLARAKTKALQQQQDQAQP